MAKSLTSTHTSLINEREEIEAKIREIETQLGQGIITLIKKHNGFKVQYSLLCGAILETLQTIDSKKDKHSDWQQKGEKFLRSIQPASLSITKKKNKKNTQTDTVNDNNRAA